MCYINKFDWSLDYQFDYNRLLHPNHHWNLTRTISLAMLHQTKAQNCSEPEAMLFWQLCRSEWEEFGQKWIKWKKIKTLRRVTKRRAGGSRPDRSVAAWTVVQPGYSLQSRQQTAKASSHDAPHVRICCFSAQLGWHCMTPGFRGFALHGRL